MCIVYGIRSLNEDVIIIIIIINIIIMAYMYIILLVSHYSCENIHGPGAVWYSPVFFYCMQFPLVLSIFHFSLDFLADPNSRKTRETYEASLSFFRTGSRAVQASSLHPATPSPSNQS